MRAFNQFLVIVLTGLLTSAAGLAAKEPKTLHVSFPIAETNFDPAQVSDLYSNTVIGGIFDGLLEYEFLAQPVRIRPNTAAALPEVSEDFRTFTIRVQPGIYFDDDPAFGGQRRELTAQDYVYSLKRHYDPRWRSPKIGAFTTARPIGLEALHERALAGAPFDYDTEIEGVRALDRYTLQIKLEQPSPRFVYNFVGGGLIGAVAREVVEHYGDKIGDHPVGTGPFRLIDWQRGSRIVLERNPTYREVFYNEHPAINDQARIATATRFNGSRLPLVDRVQISIIGEAQPRWLSFLNGQLDVIDVPSSFVNIATPNHELAPHLEQRGIVLNRDPRTDLSVSYFNMEHPLVGGYEPRKVALRRAIALAVDVEREIQLVRHGQAIPAQSIIGPDVWSYDPAFKSEMSEFNLPRAKALLDVYGYIDHDGDEWRDQPDGSPLILEYASQPDQQSRTLNELWKHDMDALGVRIEFKTASWPENLKASRAGKLMMWGVGWTVNVPEPDDFLLLGYGRDDSANRAHFKLREFDELYELQVRLPNVAERIQAIERAKRLLIAYMPYKVHVHRITSDLMQPWLLGYHGAHFRGLFWKYVDIDEATKARPAF